MLSQSLFLDGKDGGQRCELIEHHHPTPSEIEKVIGNLCEIPSTEREAW